LAARRAQGHVQHRSVLGAVDFLAREHGVDAFAQAHRLGQIQQQAQRFLRDAVLRIVQKQAGGLGAEALGAPGSFSNSSRKCTDFCCS